MKLVCRVLLMTVALTVGLNACVGAEPKELEINVGRTILFENPLPRMRCGKNECGTYNNWELAFPGVLTTRDPKLGNLLWNLRKVVWADRRLIFVDNRTIMCQLNWIRDHVHQMKGYCHWEYDLRSFLDFILDTQRADGMFYELVKQMDDRHWSFVNEDCRVFYPEDNQSLVRLEVEADIEYLMVEGCLRCWRVTGDDDWLAKALPKLEKGIDYVTSDKKRWDSEHGLVKRAYTIDTWDFTYMPDAGHNRRIEPGKTPMAIMHGDNSGVWQAMTQLAWINDRFGNPTKATEWRTRAAALKANMMKHLWNGKFFRHQLPVDGTKDFDAYENERLSMSDAYALNRGLLSLEENRSIIKEYMARRATTKGFSEWFTIDPSYEPGFGAKKSHAAGTYVNGALCPFTAGELARGAFENGYEEYGWDILSRIEKMVARDDGKIFFLYHPITGEPQGRGPSAWGAAAIISAIDEGLAGIQDLDTGYQVIRFAPRWPVTPYAELRYLTGYEAARKTVDCRYALTETGMRYNLRSPANLVKAHILLPKGKACTAVLVDGSKTAFKTVRVAGSVYVDVEVTPRGAVDFEILF